MNNTGTIFVFLSGIDVKLVFLNWSPNWKKARNKNEMIVNKKQPFYEI